MALGPGSIAFTGFNADGDDDLAFVALETIVAGTVIYFNDQEWQGTGFNTGEDQVTWTAGADIAASTIVTINSFSSSPVSNLGSVSGSSGLSSSTEIVYAYVGAAFAPTAFLAAISNAGFTFEGGTLAGTGLVVGQTAIDLSSVDAGADIGVFNGVRSGQATFADFAAQINNAAAWATQDTGGDDFADGNAPDLPFSLAAFTTGGEETQTVGFQGSTVAQDEGDAGTRTFTFIVNRNGGTTGQVDFSGTIAPGTADAADFAGGSAPTSFSGTIAAGATSQTVTVSVAGDLTPEATEAFTLTLTSALNSASVPTTLIESASVTTGTIVNDDFAAPTLGAGDIAFTGLNTDGDDNIAFVALADIPAGSTIFFQDNEWDGTAFNTGESAMAWTANALIPAGTVVTIDTINSPAPTSALGIVQVIDGSNTGYAAGGEIIYAFVGTSAAEPTTFLTAIATDGFEILADSATLAGTGLTAGVNAVAFTGGLDIVEYAGSRANQSSFDDYALALANADNFATQNAGGDQGVDGVDPDVPFDTTGFTLAAPGQTLGFANASLNVALAEGNAGTRTFSFTVERSGGTTGQLDFTGTIDAGDTDAADFGGALPGAFSGSIAAGAASTTVSIVVSGDTAIEASEAFGLTLISATNAQAESVTLSATNAAAAATIVNDDFPLEIGGIAVYDDAESLAGSTTTPVASDDVVLVRLGSIQGTVAGAESTAYESGKVYATNINGNAINVHTITAAGTLVNDAPILLSGLPSYLPGGVNSVDIKNGIIAVGYENIDITQPGFVALFDAADNSLIKTIQVGVLPDDITFTPDGTKLLVANEGEALSAQGSISIIDLSDGAAAATVVNTISFASLDGAEAALRDRGVAIAPGQPAAGDIEPEYITISADGTRAYVTLQEVNGVAVIDLTDPAADRPLSIQPLGTVDRNLVGNALDTSDRDGPTGGPAINIRNVDIQSLIQPDAIAAFDVAGVKYFVTANEGDARVNVADSVRFSAGAYVLDPTLFPDAAALKADANLGRLNVLTNVGDTDGDGDFDVIHTLGGRGISIFRQETDGSIVKVRETGGEFEAIIAANYPAIFNSNQSVAASSLDSRSDDKGPEPEGVTIGVIGDRTYAFVGLERVGGYMVYDVTDPANATFVTYKPQTADDLGPETSVFVSAADSPTGENLLISAQEISNTVTLYSVQSQTAGNDVLNGGVDADSFNGRGGDDVIDGRGGDDIIIGGAGADAIIGGAGFDTASYATASAGVVANLSTGRGSAGDALGDRFAGIEALAGSDFGDRFTGSRGDDTLNGGDGDDVLLGARGADTLVGGAGNDVLVGGLDADTFLFDAVDAGSVDIITDFLVGDGDSIAFGAGITVTAARAGFVTTGADFSGQPLANSARGLDLVLTLSSEAGSQTVHILDAYSFGTDSYWEGVLGLDLTYPRPLPMDSELLPIL